MQRNELLLVEDDPAQAAWVQHTLSSTLPVIWVDGGAKAIAYLETKAFPIILLDLKLGNGSGIELLNELRKKKLISEQTKIIVLTSSLEEEDISNAHTANINEVIHKPVKAAILKSIVQKYQRQIISNEIGEYRVGPLRFSLAEKNVFLEDENKMTRLSISLTDYRILLAMAKAANTILSRDQILDKLGDEGEVGERVIDVHINTLRTIHPFLKAHICTHRGIGYSLQLN